MTDSRKSEAAPGLTGRRWVKVALIVIAVALAAPPVFVFAVLFFPPPAIAMHYEGDERRTVREMLWYGRAQEEFAQEARGGDKKKYADKLSLLESLYDGFRYCYEEGEAHAARMLLRLAERRFDAWVAD